jgi:hypothetical protein
LRDFFNPYPRIPDTAFFLDIALAFFYGFADTFFPLNKSFPNCAGTIEGKE